MILFRAHALVLLSLLGCADGVRNAESQYVLVQQGGTAAETQKSPGGATQAGEEAVRTDRRIIYRATLRLDVTNFSEASNRLEFLVAQHGGFIASSRQGGESGAMRSGQWTFRVPADRYRSFIRELTHLGELREQNETSQEVTTEFFDLQARIRNKVQEEQRLQTHLSETTRQLSDILTIERELTRVRGEVEQLQGKLQVLDDLTSLSTIDLTVSEIQPFIPAESPKFAVRIERAWNGSMNALTRLIQSSAIAAAVMFPWIVACGIVAGVVLPITRVIRRRLHLPAT